MSDTLGRVRATLHERYAVERELGRGGSATVYLAHDLRHGREVAVKVLRPDLGEAIGSERFLREIRITARLNHPHILPMLDSGELDGLLFYVTPHVAGGSLRRRLGRETTLEDVGRVVAHVASALEYAHRHGVVHRDVKPENILFSEDLAVVADFGLAKAISAAGGDGVTRSGVPLGTPGYMSPEQAMGTLQIDRRADVYGLACVAYEMLVGETPAMWPGDEALRLGRLVDAPPHHRERLDRLPGRVEQVLTRALALRPGDRFDGVAAFEEALAAALRPTRALREEEVRAVIERATEIEAAEPTEHGRLSVGTVEQIAAEVGIRPEQVREAMRDLELEEEPPRPARRWADEVPRRPSGTGALGGGDIEGYDPKTGTIEVDRRVPGRIPEDRWPEAVELIQETLGCRGHVSTLGPRLTWSPAGQGGTERNAVVTISPLGTSTRIHVVETLELSGWDVVVPKVGAALGALLGLILSAGQDQLMVVFIVVGAIAGAYYGKRWARASLAVDEAPALERLVEELGRLAEETPTPRAGRG